MSIFDRPYLTSLFGGMVYPNGVYVVDVIDDIIEHQKIFMDVVSQIRSVNMFTFPVLTYSLLKRDNIAEEEKKEMLKTKNFDIFVDKEFARWCSDHNTTWNDSNFFMSTDVGTLSNCFTGDQFALLKFNLDTVDNRIQCDSFKNLYDNLKTTEVEALYNGEWKKGKFIHAKPSTLYKILTANGKEFISTDNHIYVTDNGEKTAQELFDDMYVNDIKIISSLQNNLSLHEPLTENNLSEEMGYIVGCYLRNGKIDYQDDIGRIVKFNIHNERLEEIHNWIKENYSIEISSDNEFNTIVNNEIPFDKMIDTWTTFYPPNIGKDLVMQCIDESIEFRCGIINGLSTDYHDKNVDPFSLVGIKISSNYKKLHNQICALMTSLGVAFKLTTSDCDDSESDENMSTYTVEIIPETEFDKIESIELYEPTGDDKLVYCVEMNEDPYFVSPNGLIVHNCCRLLSDTRKLTAFINSIGGTALSIGSIKVNTINLVRLALQHPEVNNFSDNSFYVPASFEEKYKYFLNDLRDSVKLCCKSLDVVRHIIQRNVEKGLLPNYCDGGIELDKQYCTVGILGMYEALKYFGLIKFDEFDNAFYTDEALKVASKMFEVINDVKDNFTSEYSFNCESVPGERCAVIFCQKDSKLYPDNVDTFIYSNQWIPLSQKCTISEKLRVSSILDAKCSGGAIAHINLEKNFPNTDSAWEMLNKIALSDVIYFAFNTRIMACSSHHAFIGTKDTPCPTCGELPIDSYQRIVGYLVPTSSYSSDRYKEFTTRRWYDYASELQEF